MPGLDLTPLVDAVQKNKTVATSAIALIQGIGDRVTAAVTAALEADEHADQASIDAAQAAINGVVTELNASADELAAAITSNTPSA